MNTIIRFLQTSSGRATRIVVGLALILIGILIGGFGWALAVVGVIFVVTGATNVCLLAPLAHKPVH